MSYFSIAYKCNQSVANNNSFFVDSFNDKITGSNDILYILGDIIGPTNPGEMFEDKYELGKAILSRINGTKILVPGENDRRFLAFSSREIELDPDLKTGFIVGDHIEEVKDMGQLFVLSHWPLKWWHNKERGAKHIQGHFHTKTHGSLYVGYSIHGKPIETKEALSLMSERNVPF